jgi:hypothetical protein
MIPRALRAERALRRVVSRPIAIRAALIAGLALAALPQHADAQNLFEFLFGGGQKQQQKPAAAPTENPVANFFADPFGVKEQQPQQTAQRVSGGGGPGFCVRTCDGKYFPLMRGAASPAQICQAFCPATATKVYFGASIDDAVEPTGERYADSSNAFAFRKALKSDCTCNGRSPAGLAPVDLTLDNSLRPGDVVATANGLLAYSGPRGGGSMDFTPVASYPGLTADVRNRLGEMKVSPGVGETPTVAPAADTSVAVATPPARATGSAKSKRAAVDASALPPR